MIIGADPIITVSGSGCSGCGGNVISSALPTIHYPMPACDPCGPRTGLFQRLRAKIASLRPSPSCNAAPTACSSAPVACASAPVACAPAPAACAPAPVSCCSSSRPCGTPLFTGFTTSCADPCERVGLLARLKAKFRGLRSCDACTAPHLVSASPYISGVETPILPSATVGCTPATGVILHSTAPEVLPAAPAPTATTTSSAPPAAVLPGTPQAMPTGTEPAKPAEAKPVELKPAEPKKEEPKKEFSVQLPSIPVPMPTTFNSSTTPVFNDRSR
jgi:hypothetical protein